MRSTASTVGTTARRMTAKHVLTHRTMKVSQRSPQANEGPRAGADTHDAYLAGDGGGSSRARLLLREKVESSQEGVYLHDEHLFFQDWNPPRHPGELRVFGARDEPPRLRTYGFGEGHHRCRVRTLVWASWRCRWAHEPGRAISLCSWTGPASRATLSFVEQTLTDKYRFSPWFAFSHIFNAIFAAEMLIKIVALGFFVGKGTYLHDRWNMCAVPDASERVPSTERTFLCSLRHTLFD